eukprot:gene9316-10922_t
MRDLEKKEDLTLLVHAFYARALEDELIGPVFKVSDFSIQEHIPVMVSFWETILLDAQSYSGNPIKKHKALHELVPLQAVHFERWLALWKKTIAENFKGPKADLAISRATSIAGVMQAKLSGPF